MKRIHAWGLVVALSTVICGCSKPAPVPAESKAEAAIPAFPSIDGQAVLQHTKVLSSNEYEGRAPGTHGEDLTIAYIADQYKKANVAPGNPDGTYLQKVPMVGITAVPAPLTFRKGAKVQTLAFKDDIVAWTKRMSETVTLDKSDVVFVGYGVQAPEFNWDDIKGVDLKGKTVIVLINDPPVPDPADPAALDPKTFGGKAMTYYGRWTYKYEMGQKLGAAAVLIVHETEPAAYPFSVVQSKVTEQFDLVAPDQNMSRAAVEGWITLEQAKKLFAMAGKDFDALKKQAATREFKPVPFAGVTASMTLHSKIRTIDSHNVVGKIEGSDPVLKNEYVIYTSHWDHFGIGPEVNGDKIYHGARDNATGIGGTIELGRVFAAANPRPKRSILLLAVTAEEQGLLGSDYYARNPLYPLKKTAAVINMDALNVNGRTKDLTVTGLGASELDDVAEKVAARQGRVIRPDPTPEKGGYYRSDHFPFVRMGVPALASGGGIEYLGRDADWGKKLMEAYTANDYHKPSDVVKADWVMDGAAEDLQFYWMVGYLVAQTDRLPEWKPGAEFKSKRDAMMK